MILMLMVTIIIASAIMSLYADEYHQTFVNSKDHYANMMASDITMVGIAIGFDGTWLYIVELFG